MAISNIDTEFHMSDNLTALDGIPPCESGRNGRNGVFILLISAGKAEIIIDGTPYELSHGNIVTLFPSHTITAGRQSSGLLFRLLYFGFDFMADFPLILTPEESERFGAAPCFRPDEPDFAVLYHHYETIREYYDMYEHPSREKIIKAQLFTFISELLFRCAGTAKDIRASREKLLTDGFFQLLHRYYKTERTLAFYAGRLCITTKHLSKTIRRTTGHTVYFWIEEFTVKEAKLLLRSSQATVTEIAEQLNFPNSSFFAKFFRRHTGLSPTQFRRQTE